MGHPFPYVGSGVAAARKTMWCMVRFAKAVPKPARAALVKGVPSPLAGYFDWKDKTLTFGNDDDSLQWVVRAAYDHVRDDDDEYEPDPELPSDAMWKAFNAELDKWLVGVHKKHPIALVIKPIDDEYSTATDAWHDWSCAQIDKVLPIAAAIDDQTARYVAQLWKEWVEAQPFAKQQKLVGALPAATKKALATHDALVEPAKPEPEPERPSLDQFERIWRDAQGGVMRLEDAFAAAMIERGIGTGYSLSAHMSQLQQANRTGDAIELARAVLASGAEFPTNWSPPLANLLIAERRLDEAEPVVRQVVAELESYKPEMLTTAMRYHAARGERDVEALLYHAGMRWFTTFSYNVPKAQAKQYGAAPADLPRRFMDWLERWLADSVWIPASMMRLSHWLVWFDSIGPAHCAPRVAQFEAERNRRNAVYKELETVADETAARALIEQLLPTVTSESAFRAFTTFRERAPLAAYELLDCGIANERREGYRYPTGERVNAVIALTYLALDQPSLATQLDHAYEIARGYVLVPNAALHFNLACCACRLGKRTEALGHVARSLALNFPNPQQIHDDNDLAPLRGDAVYEKLFIDDATRREAEAREAAEGEQKKATQNRKKKPSAKKPAAKKPAAKKPAKAAKKKPVKKK